MAEFTSTVQQLLAIPSDTSRSSLWLFLPLSGRLMPRVKVQPQDLRLLRPLLRNCIMTFTPVSPLLPQVSLCLAIQLDFSHLLTS